jgi:ketosteroid isomerase-like protein
MRRARCAVKDTRLRTVAAIAVTLLAPGIVRAQAVVRSFELDSMVATEFAFAQTASQRNVRDAFLAYIANDGILFRPGPVSGRAALLAQQPSADKLAWRPIYAEISASGDLGYTTGPWSLHPASGAAPGYGHFVTVWRKLADGTWRFALDIGIRAPADTAYPYRVEQSRPAPARGAPGTLRDVLHADSALAGAAISRGYPAALLDMLAEGGRILRNGQRPAAGAAAARAFLTDGAMTWRTIAGDISTAGDLGYTYGSYELRSVANTTESGNFLHIWRRGPNSAWRIVVDLLNPISPRPGAGASGGAGQAVTAPRSSRQ